MGENEDEKQAQASQVFENFVQATTCKGTLQAFNILTCLLDLNPLDHRNFYSQLKAKVNTWKAKALWHKLDKRGSHKEYKRGKACSNTKCLIVGGGPCGLRTAIELAYLGAKVVVVEKRDTFSRNNVLHLWPFTIHDLRGLGAKKFYGKFCAGSIDHISIRQLQLILFKVALMLGVEIHVNVEFVRVLEPPEDQENQKVGWRAEFLPADHALSDFEFDVIIGADGHRNTLEGFRRKEFRGKLAIAITANFINRNSTAEAKVEEISGVAFIFNQKFFQDLKEETGIDLENIVYYKDSTHYFVMTAKKQSLLDKGVILNDYIDTEMLLCSENVNQDNLLSYAREAADFATNYQLPSLDFAINHNGQPDVAMFDFTSMYASENAALMRERQAHQLLVALVGDSLLEPFWPMGTGCARGFLAAFDTAWMVKSWDQGTPPLEVLAERESLYRLLPQTTPENINKNFEQYTLDPATRYPNLNLHCVRPHQVKHLYITKEMDRFPLERWGSVRRSVSLSRRESDIRPNKLLTWCQQQTKGYQHVRVTDLTTSWRSGLALCAIIHSFRPELINFDSLNEDDAVENNQLAFDVAKREFGILPVTTGKEMASTQEPDKLSMVMYLSKFYELFRGTPLRPMDSWRKNYGENADFGLGKTFIQNNYLNLTLPRKRTPRVDTQTEENDMNKRRRQGFNNLEELPAFSSRSLGSNQEYAKESGNQNKVKYMANQLLAKFEENSRNPSALKQDCRGVSGLGFSSTVATGQVLRELNQVPASGEGPSRPWRARAKSDLQLGGAENLATLPPTCQGALALSGVLRRLQQVEEKVLQKRAQILANREFHTKNIKEKAAHLASMFGHGDLPQDKLLSKRPPHAHPPSPPSCLPSPHPAAASSPPAADSVSPARKLTVGKVSSGIGAAAEVLVNLYLNDHRPKTQATSPDLESLRKTFPLSLGGKDTCYFCKKRVYVMERLSAEGHFFHRECFRCSVCTATLRLAAYAFDCDEGKFYCKPHFIHCKTSSKQRKRRAELNQQREEEGTWQEQEAPRRDVATESSCAVAAISTPEGSPPAANEPISPKKPKSVPEPNPRITEAEATSPRPSEWTSVRIGPGEDSVGRDVLAVRVLVTSEDSSSDTESDCDSITAPCAEACEERPWLPESPCPSKPLTRHISLRETLTQPGSLPLHHEEPQAMPGSAAGPQPPVSNFQQIPELERKIPVQFNTHEPKSTVTSKGASSSPSIFVFFIFPVIFIFFSQYTWAHYRQFLLSSACNLHSLQTSRDNVNPTSIYLRRARAQGIAKEMPLYLPHSAMLESTEHCLVGPSGEGLRSPEAISASEGRQEAQAFGNTESIHQDSHPTAGKDQYLPNQNLALGTAGNLGDLSEESRTGQPGGPELSKERKSGLKKLVLTEEQKTKLLDWSDHSQEHKAGEQESAENSKGSSLKPICSSTLSQAVKEKLLSQKKALGGMRTPAVKVPQEREVPPPKSPLRLIANAILRSLRPNSEAGKKTSPKPESKTLPRGQPHAVTRSFSLRKLGSSKDGDQQSPGRHMAKKASAFFSLASPTSKAAQASDLSPPDPILRSRSLPSRPSKMFFATTSVPPHSKIEDVPTLLEKVSLQDVTQGPKKGASNISSLGLKDKSFESFLQECKQRKDIGDFFNSPKEKGPPGNRVPSLEKLVPPVGSTSLGHVPRPSSTGQDARPGTPVTEATSSPTSSSAEEDVDSLLSSRIKATMRAQAIQRQLEEVEERQRMSEIQGVKLEKVLRGETDSGTQDEAQLLQEWFKLVLEKNKLMRYESELLIMAQELELEDHQSRLEQKLRQKMLKDEGQKDENDLKEEQEIFKEMMQVIEQRNKLVDSLEEQRVKERTQDQHFENFVLSRGCQLSRT
ncbi:F-actin monooxygenase [Apodemus speciosus]|uniref:F-actin monooxygenase n=1 Tax=Apodemus speciosus TaxID=105296 RepID=A0ABQ0EZW2_APOSI